MTAAVWLVVAPVVLALLAALAWLITAWWHGFTTPHARVAFVVYCPQCGYEYPAERDVYAASHYWCQHCPEAVPLQRKPQLTRL